MAENRFVDFAVVKQRVTMQQVLERYGIFKGLTGEGTQRKGPSPFAANTRSGSRAFSVNLDKNVWMLFGKQERGGGNVIDFVMRKEGCGVREAALKLVEWFRVEMPKRGEESSIDEPRKSGGKEPHKELADESSIEEATASGEANNAPLRFELQGLDTEHSALAPLLDAWRIETATLRRFGAGYYGGKGKTMHGRLAVPIDRFGVRVGYCGIKTDLGAGNSEPFYKFPDKWVHGVELYNLKVAVLEIEKDLVAGRETELILFRDILHVWQAIQLGHLTAVAVLGKELTSNQLATIYSLDIPARARVSLELHIEGSLI